MQSVESDPRIKKFIEMLHKKYGGSEGANLIFRYFQFQFTYFKEITFDKNNNFKQIDLSKIIGKAAFKRWVNRDTDFDQFTFDKAAEYFKVSVGCVLEPEPKHQTTSNAEEKLKALFDKNHKKRFLHCLENTTLYNPLSSFCQSCKMKDSCIEAQKENYKSIYNSRKTIHLQ